MQNLANQVSQFREQARAWCEIFEHSKKCYPEFCDTHDGTGIDMVKQTIEFGAQSFNMLNVLNENNALRRHIQETQTQTTQSDQEWLNLVNKTEAQHAAKCSELIDNISNQNFTVTRLRNKISQMGDDAHKIHMMHGDEVAGLTVKLHDQEKEFNFRLDTHNMVVEEYKKVIKALDAQMVAACERIRQRDELVSVLKSQIETLTSRCVELSEFISHTQKPQEQEEQIVVMMVDFGGFPNNEKEEPAEEPAEEKSSGIVIPWDTLPEWVHTQIESNPTYVVAGTKNGRVAAAIHENGNLGEWKEMSNEMYEFMIAEHPTFVRPSK